MMNPEKGCLYGLSAILLIQLCNSISTISPNQSLKDRDILVSRGQNFVLGFFSPGKSTHRYVGIWYYRISERTVVWVANRDNPINDTSGILSVADGNLVIHSSNQVHPVWSTNVSASNSAVHGVELLDTGNLVLYEEDSKRVLWQSFDHLSDTYLSDMKLGLDRKTGMDRFLTSWKSPDDPGTGNYSYKFDFKGFPQMFLYQGPVPTWRVGSWTGQRWSGIPEMTRNFIFNVTFVNDLNETTIMYEMKNKSIISRLVLSHTGMLERYTWNEAGQKWIQFWEAPKERCDSYFECGSNSYCDPYQAEEFECKCLIGFEPKNPNEWNIRYGSGGCVRKGGATACRNGEGFLKITRLKVPETTTAHVNMSMSLRACKEECLKNCNCTAYTVGDEGRMIGCLMWTGELVDMRKFSNAGQDLYFKVDSDTLAQYSKKSNKRMVTILSLSGALALFLLFAFVYWLVSKIKGRIIANKTSFNYTSSTVLDDSLTIHELHDDEKNSELPLFNLSTIIEATDNFSAANELGKGGFGLVYKGLLGNIKEIAVKRLSKYSGQGAEEFKNEIVLIAKLQHRNLVRILGYCIEEEEKMLIYEFVPNKSLDAFIFDETKKFLLNWPKRFDIILGVARGILYLHQDSRLRIVHRDLKSSNVLLDASMNPKIADFGMARIFGGDETEGNTNRVVGTYGYMSPEYAMEGVFSVKSDVYSFGVLLLEIVTGKRNSSYFPECPFSNLVGYVWELWKEGKDLDLVDQSMGDSYSNREVSRCIEIALLCVQEHAQDRPTMSEVIFMLANNTPLPSPKQPAFIFTKRRNGGEASSTSEGVSSVNDVTISSINAR